MTATAFCSDDSIAGKFCTDVQMVPEAVLAWFPGWVQVQSIMSKDAFPQLGIYFFNALPRFRI